MVPFTTYCFGIFLGIQIGKDYSYRKSVVFIHDTEYYKNKQMDYRFNK